MLQKKFCNIRLKDYETWICQTIYFTFAVSKKKKISYNEHKPIAFTFSKKLFDPLSMTINTYDNFIVMGDFNVDVNKDQRIVYKKLELSCDTFNLTLSY